jgi:hypothetical protein
MVSRISPVEVQQVIGNGIMVKILLPATGVAGYAASWLSVVVKGGEPPGKFRSKEGLT